MTDRPYVNIKNENLMLLVYGDRKKEIIQ